ncbi:MAG: alpha-L-fucosidase [Bryobacterales bacterium]|nr:alpha-L-fucosidase [Bryobacterales bacterium]
MTRREWMAMAAAPDQDTIAFEKSQGIRRPAAGWFTQAGFGLFLHWGICTVREVELGWGFFGDVGGKKGAWPVQNYIAQADVFSPSSYDPDPWMEAAARAGFRYAVLTTRHHDGYALWPSRYGNFSTREHMGGRDLLKPYVEACRRHGLRVGFYYSPGNWLFHPQGWPYLGYPLARSDFRYRRPERTLGVPRYVSDSRENLQKHFEILYAYVRGQLGELLTHYGKIDLLWWDGYDWPRGVDIHGPEIDAWVRKLQPGLVTNDRYRLWSERPTLGDFSTEFENRDPDRRPEGAWEQCEALCGGWAYTGPEAACKTPAYVLERLIRNRAWGGNYLADFGPRKDGTMATDYYRTLGVLAEWMKHSGASLDGVTPLENPGQADVPVTVKGSTWYLHLLGWQRSALVKGQPDAGRAVVMRTGKPAKIDKRNGGQLFTIPIGLRPDLDEVIEVRFR